MHYLMEHRAGFWSQLLDSSQHVLLSLWTFRRTFFSIGNSAIAQVSQMGGMASRWYAVLTIYTDAWYLSKKKCCLSDDCKSRFSGIECVSQLMSDAFLANEFCPMWTKWSMGLLNRESESVDFAAYIFLTVVLATASCLLTLTTRTVFPGALNIRNVDEDLSSHASGSNTERRQISSEPAPVAYYSAAGSGVAEVKVILSGFVLHVC